MEPKRYRPKVGGLYYAIFLPTLILILAVAVFAAIYDPFSLAVTVTVFLLILYFAVSPLFGYVELRENTVFIRYGFFLTREIEYVRIRELKKERKPYTETMLSLKNAMEHVTVKYNKFDVTTVSVTDNDDLMINIRARIEARRIDSGI